MLALRPKAVRAAERLPTAISRGTRRHASGHGADHGHHAGPKEESLGVSACGTETWAPADNAVASTMGSPRRDPHLRGSLHNIQT